MKFLISGTGGVGGFFGAKLAEAGNEVWFLARGAHLDAMQHSGLRVESTQGAFTVLPARMIAHPSEAGTDVDVVLFCVKSYDTESAAAQLLESGARKSLVLSLQNGIDNEEKLRRLLPEAEIAGGVAYISSRIERPGMILETGGFQRIVYGSFSSHRSHRFDELGESFLRSGIRADYGEDITKELWKKFIFIASVGGLSALTRLTQGEILACEETRLLVFRAMKEVESVGIARGVALEPLVKERVFEAMGRFNPATRASMYFDLVNGKPMELDALSGTVRRLGCEYSIPTPVHDTIYASLLPHHQLALQKSRTL
ncbi:MAG TPA: ketopantoate reductase family protein [Bacteroidota bacterium]|nr:ketopantoate reductase family protein [Bacteroidota bacterium]